MEMVGTVLTFSLGSDTQAKEILKILDTWKGEGRAVISKKIRAAIIEHHTRELQTVRCQGGLGA